VSVAVLISGEYIGMHTDNPYREPCPDYQLLHAIEHCSGPDCYVHNTFVDGFAVAKKLFMDDPHSFDLLASTAVRWENNGGDGTSSFVKYAPYIEVEPREKYSSVGTLDGLSHPPILFYGLMNSLEL
jgi:gamma-butyrobetaine dioxygenase